MGKGKFGTVKSHKRGGLGQEIGKMCVWDGMYEEYHQRFTFDRDFSVALAADMSDAIVARRSASK